jgi:hypothetical protein
VRAQRGGAATLRQRDAGKEIGGGLSRSLAGCGLLDPAARCAHVIGVGLRGPVLQSGTTFGCLFSSVACIHGRVCPCDQVMIGNWMRPAPVQRLGQPLCVNIGYFIQESVLRVPYSGDANFLLSGSPLRKTRALLSACFP